MILLDSNVLIDSLKPATGTRLDWLFDEDPAVSAVSYVEVLGYHRLSESDRELLEDVFIRLHVLGLCDRVLDRAVSLRQRRRMTLGDALVAAAALVHDLPIATRNLRDFEGVDGLTAFDPWEVSTGGEDGHSPDNSGGSSLEDG